jgi:uncharacterized protein (DUF2147 family)
VPSGDLPTAHAEGGTAGDDMEEASVLPRFVTAAPHLDRTCSPWSALPLRPRCAALLLAALLALAAPRAIAVAAVPEGVWLIDGKAALQIFDCGGLLCGRILWLQTPRDPQGRLKRDRHNPDPALRQRWLCGMTILWNLRSTGPGRWGGGWFYNPDDGKTYNVSAELRSADLLVARVYSGMPLFGETKTLLRVPHGTSEGWC